MLYRILVNSRAECTLSPSWTTILKYMLRKQHNFNKQLHPIPSLYRWRVIVPSVWAVPASEHHVRKHHLPRGRDHLT